METLKIRVENWNIQEMTGYEPVTTFYQDFSIADMFGVDAVKDTYERALEYAKLDYKYLTELVLALNWKIWRWNDENDELANLYNELWEAAFNLAMATLTDDEMEYFYRITD